MLDSLVLADGSPEHDPLARILGGSPQGIPADADRFARHQDPLGVQAVQDILEPLPFLADAILLGHEQIVYEHRVGVHGVAAHLADAAHLHFGAVEIGVEQRHPVGRSLALLLGGRAGQQQDLVRDLAG